MSFAARLLRSQIHPDTDPIHVRVYAGFWGDWDNIGQAPNALAANAADVGAVSFQQVNGRWGLYGPQLITMAGFTGPAGNFTAVAYRPTDGMVLTAKGLGSPVDRGERAENYVRLQIPGGRYFGIYDDARSGFHFGNTYWGELLYLGGYIDWENLPWAAVLLDAAWPVDFNVQFLSQIPSAYWLGAAPLNGRVVLEDGRAICQNTAFTNVPPGRNMGHVAIFQNGGDADVLRILTTNLAGKGVSTGVPVWLDFAGRPALWFGYGTG